VNGAAADSPAPFTDDSVDSTVGSVAVAHPPSIPTPKANRAAAASAAE
jgi:hypothetical protein